MPKSTSKSTLWGTPSQVPKSTPKALFGALTFQPGLLGTPVNLGARPRGRTATQRSKKGSGKVLGRFWEGFWGRGSEKGSEKGACYGFYSKEGF